MFVSPLTLLPVLALLAPLVGVEAAAARDEVDPASGTLFLHPERVPLQNGDHVTIERGMLFTHLVRSDPKSAIIGVEVVRFRALDGATEGTPPIFQLHGGPGWPGLGAELEPGYYERQVVPMIQHCDLVVIGQRGIGSSKPNTSCEDMPEVPEGATQEEVDRIVVEGVSACREYWEGRGYDLRGFNVIEAAADVDDVRRLLGYEQVTLWGGSFGSHWSMAIMRYFPDGVARAVLTGMEGPDHTYDMPSGVLSALELMAGEAELSPRLIEHIPDRGLMQALRDVFARVREEPVEVEVRHPSTGKQVVVRFDETNITDLAMGYTNRVNSRSGIPSWAADVIRLYSDNWEPAARAWLANQAEPDRGLPTASFFSLDCGSGISPARLKTLKSDPAALIVGDLGHFYETACGAWDSDLGEEFRAGFETDIPTVIVHGTWDVSTPFDNALECLDLFSNAHFVVVDGGTHGALGEAMRFSPGFRAALMKFAQSGDRSGLPEELRLPELVWVAPRG